MSGAPPLRRKVAAATVGLSLLVQLFASVGVYWGVDRALSTHMDGMLVNLVRTELASAIDEPGEPVHVHDDGPLATPDGYEKYVSIEEAPGKALAQTSNLSGAGELAPDPAERARALAGTPVLFDRVVRGRALRVLSTAVTERSGRRLVATVGVSREGLDQTLATLARVLAGMVALGTMLAGALGIRLASALVRPLEDIAAAARSIGAGSTSTRIGVVSSDRELCDLAAAIDAMLDRLEASLQAQQRLVESQRRLVADASHELRSPLTNLRGTIEVALRRERDGADYRETLRVTLAEVARLSRLVDDMLLLSRSDAGSVPLATGPFDLAALVRASARAHEATADVGQRRIAVEAPDTLPAHGDPDGLRRAIDNVLDNALVFAPPGTDVTLSAGRDDQGLWVRVSDRGPGIDPADLPRIFDRFYRADPSRARRSGGAGLGLPISRAIVEAHGGTLDTESRPGAGAAFVLRLPA